MTTLTTNQESEILKQIEICKGNLQMLNDFAPNHALVLKNIKWLLELVKSLEVTQSHK